VKFDVLLFKKKSVENIEVSLNLTRLTDTVQEDLCSCIGNILLNSSKNDKCFTQICGEIKTHILCSVTFMR